MQSLQPHKTLDVDVALEAPLAQRAPAGTVEEKTAAPEVPSENDKSRVGKTPAKLAALTKLFFGVPDLTSARLEKTPTKLAALTKVLGAPDSPSARVEKTPAKTGASMWVAFRVFLACLVAAFVLSSLLAGANQLRQEEFFALWSASSLGLLVITVLWRTLRARRRRAP